MQTEMQTETALYFREKFREAREAAQRDAENFDSIVFVLEKLGSLLTEGKRIGLAAYKNDLTKLARMSPLAEVEESHRPFHVPFLQLFDFVRQGRNTAMHEGVFARNLTQHAIQLSIILEDALALKVQMNHVSNFMVRNPICAEPWQPLSFIRQSMLAHSYSYLPVKRGDGGRWSIVSDLAIAAYLRSGDRKVRLAQTLDKAIAADLVIPDAHTIHADMDVHAVLTQMTTGPAGHILLVTDPNNQHLLGIVTPFDLL
jgi:CBS domain-containing protein